MIIYKHAAPVIYKCYQNRIVFALAANQVYTTVNNHPRFIAVYVQYASAIPCVGGSDRV